jgi:phosphatidate cytidylyltransferase
VASALAKYNNLTQRTITGLLGAAAVITGVCYSEWTYFLLFFILVLAATREFYILAGFDGMIIQRSFGVFCGLVVYCISFFIEQGTLEYRYYFVIFPLVSLIYMIKLYKKSERKPFTNIAFTFLGILYVALPISLLNIATGAYFAGTFLGKRKLFERISPKKTWEGFFGGAALAMVFAIGIPFFFESIGQVSTLTLIDWIIVGVLIIVGGTFGDLVESLLKRSIEIKDSGTALPGHGGFLDRFDGLFISAPFNVAYIEIF